LDIEGTKKATNFSLNTAFVILIFVIQVTLLLFGATLAKFHVNSSLSCIL